MITLRDWLSVALLGLVWGCTFLMIKMALQGVTPFWLAAYRITLAATLMAGIWGLRGFVLWKDPHDRTGHRILILSALMSSAAPFMLISWGQQFVTSGFTGVCMAAVALVVLPLAHVFVPGERMQLRKTIGFVIGFAGVVTLIGTDNLGSTGLDGEWQGRVAILAATFCYAASSIMIQRLPPMDVIGLASVHLLIGMCAVLPAAWIVEGLPSVPPLDTLFWVLVLGLVSTAGANFLRIVVIRSAGATFMSLTNYQVPLWAMVMGAIVLNEALPGRLWLALLLILSGLALSQYGALVRLFSKRPVSADQI